MYNGITMKLLFVICTINIFILLHVLSMNLPPSRFTNKSSNGIQQNFLYLFLKILVSGNMYILILEVCCWNTKGTREYGHTFGPDTSSSRG